MASQNPYAPADQKLLSRIADTLDSMLLIMQREDEVIGGPAPASKSPQAETSTTGEILSSLGVSEDDAIDPEVAELLGLNAPAEEVL